MLLRPFSYRYTLYVEHMPVSPTPLSHLSPLLVPSVALDSFESTFMSYIYGIVYLIYIKILVSREREQTLFVTLGLDLFTSLAFWLLSPGAWWHVTISRCLGEAGMATCPKSYN